MTTRTAQVRLEIPNPDMKLSPGNVRQRETRRTPWDGSWSIPASGVFQSGTRQIAFVDHGDGYFEPREIETGTARRRRLNCTERAQSRANAS